MGEKLNYKGFEMEETILLMTIEEMISHWQRNKWNKKLTKRFGRKVQLLEDKIDCLKNSRERSSIWKVFVTDGVEQIPVIIKIFKLPLKDNHLLEIGMYQNGTALFQEFMPRLYLFEKKVNGEEAWLFTECLDPLRGQIKITPEHLEQIIPTVAKFHALTFENRFTQNSQLFDPSLPTFDSVLKVKEREQGIKKAKKYLDLAMKDPNVKELNLPRYNLIKSILEKGPIFFPELWESGQCLIHGDLHIHNICCKNATDEKDWQIYLIDWESAKYYPCWYDLVVLVELLIDFRSDWQKREEEIRRRCVNLYTKEMQKYGVTFNEDPLNLLKKAYLQRTLEKKLAGHLNKVVNGEKSPLLKRYLEKIEVWGKELGLY
jgi:thiamine kinase-like enzyme